MQRNVLRDFFVYRYPHEQWGGWNIHEARYADRLTEARVGIGALVLLVLAGWFGN